MDPYYTGQHGSLVATRSTLEFNVNGTRVEIGGLVPGTEYDTVSSFYPDSGGYPTEHENGVVDADGDLYFNIVSGALDLRHGEYVVKVCERDGGHTPLAGPDGEPMWWAFRIPTTYLQYHLA